MSVNARTADLFLEAAISAVMGRVGLRIAGGRDGFGCQ